MIIRLDTTFLNKTIKGSNFEMRFKYNTHHDYFYFDLYFTNGETISLGQKIVAGKYNDNISFNSIYPVAKIDNIEAFSLSIK